jgi:hypothetical protein
VQGWTVLPDGLVEVGTDRGTYRTEKLVLAAGAWMDQLVPELKVWDPVGWEQCLMLCSCRFFCVVSCCDPEPEA